MPKKQFDLHLHTYYSDGRESPEKILTRAKQADLALVSFSDHNTIAHCLEEKKIADRLKVNFIPGVELSVVYEGRHLHLLGYGFNSRNIELNKIIAEIQAKRRVGIFKITEKLRGLGFDVKDAELTALPAEYFGLAHIIRILEHKPAEKRRIQKEVGSSDIFAVINYYFAHAREAYVAEEYLPAVKMIKLIRAAGGITSLAHPGSHLSLREDGLITKLKACGLDALEVFTPKHNWDQIVHYEILAKKLNMVITVGSNYHEDFHQQDVPIVTPIGFIQSPPEVFDRFASFLAQRTGYKQKY